MNQETSRFLAASEGRSLDRLLELDADWNPVLMRGGRARLKAGVPAFPPHRKFRRASRFFRMTGLGKASRLLGAAREDLRRRPGDVETSMLAGRLYLALGRHEEAHFCLARVPSSASPEVLMSVAQSKIALGDYEGAAALLKKWPKIFPLDPWMLAWRSEARRSLGDGQGARADLAQALALSPADPGLLVLAGRLGSAARLERALKADPQGFWPLVYHGWEMLKRGDFGAAVRDFSKLTALDPECDWAWLWKSIAREKNGDRPGADLDRERAVFLDPAAIWSYSRMAKEIGAWTDWRAVYDDCFQSVRLDPGDAVPYALRAECGDQRDSVAEDWRRALELDGSRPWFRALHAGALAFDGNVRGAAAEIEKAADAWPECGWLVSLRGEIREKGGDSAGALSDQDRAISMSEGCAKAYALRGSLRRRTGDLAGAREDLDRALELDLEHAERVLDVSRRVRVASGDVEGAQDDLKWAAHRNMRYFFSKDDSRRSASGDLRRSPLAGCESAYRSFVAGAGLGRELKRVLARAPRLAWAHALQGALLSKRGEYMRAAAELEIFLKLSPEDCGASLERARMLRRAGKAPEAIRICDRLLRAASRDAWVHQERALDRLAAGDLAGAFADQLRAERDDARQPRIFGFQDRPLARDADRHEWAHAELKSMGRSREELFRSSLWRGCLHLERRRLDRARADLRRALRLHPQSSWALGFWAKLLLVQGRPNEAIAASEKIRGSIPAWLEAARGEAFVRTGAYEEARAAFERALSLDPADAAARLGRAGLREMSGDSPGALEDLNRLLIVDTVSAWLFVKRGRILLGLNRHDAAERDFSGALAVHPRYAEAFHLRGQARLALGRKAEAREDFDAAGRWAPAAGGKP